jgi:hypothetical protein
MFSEKAFLRLADCTSNAGSLPIFQHRSRSRHKSSLTFLGWEKTLGVAGVTAAWPISAGAYRIWRPLSNSY